MKYKYIYKKITIFYQIKLTNIRYTTKHNEIVKSSTKIKYKTENINYKRYLKW